MWNVSWHEADETVVARNAICIFEHDLGFPVSRHRTGGGPSEYGFANFGAVKGAQLTVRTIATIGNVGLLTRRGHAATALLSC